jgi:hypothetical protein
MSALDQLRKRAGKREAKLKRKKKKDVEERELQKVKEEAFEATETIYIKPLASRLPPIFQESSEGRKRHRT